MEPQVRVVATSASPAPILARRSRVGSSELLDGAGNSPTQLPAKELIEDCRGKHDDLAKKSVDPNRIPSPDLELAAAHLNGIHNQDHGDEDEDGGRIGEKRPADLWREPSVDPEPQGVSGDGEREIDCQPDEERNVEEGAAPPARDYRDQRDEGHEEGRSGRRKNSGPAIRTARPPRPEPRRGKGRQSDCDRYGAAKRAGQKRDLGRRRTGSHYAKRIRGVFNQRRLTASR